MDHKRSQEHVDEIINKLIYLGQQQKMVSLKVPFPPTVRSIALQYNILLATLCCNISKIL